MAQYSEEFFIKTNTCSITKYKAVLKLLHKVVIMEFIFQGVIKDKKNAITPLTTDIQAGRDHNFPKGMY